MDRVHRLNVERIRGQWIARGFEHRRRGKGRLGLAVVSVVTAYVLLIWTPWPYSATRKDGEPTSTVADWLREHHNRIFSRLRSLISREDGSDSRR
jgi:hypothetical protein